MVAIREFSLLVSLPQRQGCCSLRVRVICDLGSGNRTSSDTPQRTISVWRCNMALRVWPAKFW